MKKYVTLAAVCWFAVISLVGIILTVYDKRIAGSGKRRIPEATLMTVGLLGAAALDVSHLRGRRLINIDSEEEGVFTVGCAGGATARCVLPVTRTACAGHVMTVTVSGLRGGHSGS